MLKKDPNQIEPNLQLFEKIEMESCLWVFSQAFTRHIGVAMQNPLGIQPRKFVYFQILPDICGLKHYQMLFNISNKQDVISYHQIFLF